MVEPTMPHTTHVGRHRAYPRGRHRLARPSLAARTRSILTLDGDALVGLRIVWGLR